MSIIFYILCIFGGAMFSRNKLKYSVTLIDKMSILYVEVKVIIWTIQYHFVNKSQL